MRRWTPWLSVWVLTIALTILSTAQSLTSYREFRSGWPWDLAYNNQWFWALVRGDQTLSIRPINSWGDEGPSIWVRTHLDPIRLPIIPIYALYPDPITLLILHNVIIWWIVPAAYGLLRSETESEILALSGTALVPLTPLLWPLLWNDFREMALAIPFVIWAVQGFRLRHRGLAALGIMGMLACREEFGVMVATFALIPPKVKEPIGTTYNWARTAVTLGVGWVVFAFFGFEYWMVGRSAPTMYLAHFGGEKPGLIATGRTAVDLLGYGVASWLILAAFAPRFGLLALPWIWGVTHGRWSLALLTEWRWHHVRYVTPIVALVVAAGLHGYLRVGTWTLRQRHGTVLLASLWVALAIGLGFGCWEVNARMAQIAWPISRIEAAELWKWIDQVGEQEPVIASYEVTAPLSSRRLLYSTELDMNKPKGYPMLGPEFGWAFLRKRDLDPEILIAQGFEVVYQGNFIWVYHRPPRNQKSPI